MPLRLVKAKEYKVKDGDTLDSIAKANGLTVKQLAQFNWKSDDAGKENVKLRDKVGSRKKDSTDKKSYILSKDDDPGIIYIPEKPDPPKTFPTNGTHALTVKAPEKKTYKTSDTTVRFRPKAGWKGEAYGFDWMRAADYEVNGLFGALDFDKDIFGKLYIPVGGAAATQTLQTDGNSYTGDFRADAEMLKKAKKDEYLMATLKDTAGKDMNTFAAHINIYINEKDLKPPQTVDIQALVNNKNEVLDELVFEIKEADQEFVKISTTATLTKLAVKDDQKLPLKLECTKPITKDIEIVAKAITRGTDGSYLEKVVGKLIVHPNDKTKRKHIKILLVEVKTPALATGGTDAEPDMTNQEQLFAKLLRQALVNPVITKPNIKLDLTADAYFKTNFTHTRAGKTKILSYRSDAAGKIVKIDGKYWFIQEYMDVKLKEQLVKAKSPIAAKFDDYIKAYYFGEDGKADEKGTKDSNLNGYSTGKYVVMFKSRNEGTSPHEFLHSLGLPHTFDTGAAAKGVSANAKFSYKYAETENIMDYSHHKGGAYNNGRVTTYHWQWAIVNGHTLSQPNDE